MAKSKSFKDEMTQQQTNPATTYFSAPPATEEKKKEYKSKRLNLMIKPSVHANIEKIAAMKRKSVNALINDTLEAYVSDNDKLLAKYPEWLKMNDSFDREG